MIRLDIQTAIQEIEHSAADPRTGLPNEVFRLVSRLVPMVNVDLLIQDELHRTLLSWRDDEFAGRGWHVPGGIIRYKETAAERIRQVMETEIGMILECEPAPAAVNDVIVQHETRGHFISLLYRCRADSRFIPENRGVTRNTPGYLEWHKTCPDNLVEVHEMYRQIITEVKV